MMTRLMHIFGLFFLTVIAAMGSFGDEGDPVATNSYTVAFDANGGTGSDSIISTVYGKAFRISTGREFQRIGYRFAGWSTNSHYDVVYAGGAVVSNLTDIADGVVTLYAVWNANRYSVSFDANNGDGSITNYPAVYNESLKLPGGDELSRAGYTFAGWGKTENGNVAFAGAEVVSNLTVTANATVKLFAIWKGISYTVDFVPSPEGVLANGEVSQSFVYGEPAKLFLNCYARDGYEFLGWSKESETTVVEYTDGQIVSNLTFEADAIVRLYPVWGVDETVNTHTVRPLDLNDFEIETSPAKEIHFHGNLNNDERFQMFTVTPTQSGTYRISLDPTIGLRLGAELFVSVNGEDINDAISVTDLDDSEVLVTFEAGTTYLFEVYANADDLIDNGNYRYVVGINRKAATVRFDVDREFLEDDSAGTNFVFTIGTRYGYIPYVKYRDDVPFKGWFHDLADENSVKADDFVIDSNSQTLTPVWENNKYTVLFDTNDPTYEGSVTNYNVVYSQSFELPSGNAFNRIGYTLSGWSDGPTNSVIYTPGQVVSNLTDAVDGEVTLFANWQINKYTVDFDANGGIGPDTKLQVTYNEEFTIPTGAGFTRTGYVFSGWSKVANGEVLYSGGNVVYNLSTDNDVVVKIYAVWTPITYTVSFEVKEEDADFDGAITNLLLSAVYDKPIQLPSGEEYEFKREDYIFVGWSANKDDSVVYPGGVNATNITSVANGHVTLHAVWQLNVCVVIFNMDGGTGVVTNYLPIRGQSFVFPSGKGLTREGYTFSGWSDGKNDYKVGEISGEGITQGERLEILAKWEPIPYRITFDANGGDANKSITDIIHTEYDSEVNLPSISDFELTRTNFVFLGWSDSYYGQPLYGDKDVVLKLTTIKDKLVTLYAVWGGDSYKIVYHAGDYAGVYPNNTFEQEVYYGRNVELMRNCFIRPGFLFKGWSKGDSGKNKDFADGEILKNADEFKFNEDGKVHLYAVWEQNKTFRPIVTNLNEMVELSFTRTQKRLLITGSLTSKTNEVTFKVKAKDDGTYRVSLDPIVGRRINAHLSVKLEGSEDTSAATTPQSSENTNQVNSVLVSDFDRKSSTMTFVAGKTYLFEVSASLNDLRWNGVYKFGVGINLEEVSVEFVDVPEEYLYMKGKEENTYYGTNFVFSAETPYGYMPYVFQKDGHQFSGWYEELIGGDPIRNYDIVRSGKLHPKWELGEFDYWIKFNPNGGNGSMPRIQVSSHDLIYLPTNSFVREGYAFEGWSLNASDKVAKFYDGNAIDYPLAVTNGMTNTLYAVWNDKMPSVLSLPDDAGIRWLCVPTKQGARIQNWDEEYDLMKPAIPIDIAGDIAIPEVLRVENESGGVRELKVIGIGENAFSDCLRITGVTVPKTVATLAEAAFSGMASLKTIVFKSNHLIEDIPDRCFAGCTSLTTIDIPYSVSSIGEEAFGDCMSLSPSIVIPENVDSIGARAFRNCINLKQVNYIGNEPNMDIIPIDSDEMYDETPANLISAVLATRLNEDWTQRKDGIWKDHIITTLVSKNYSLVRVTFDANGALMSEKDGGGKTHKRWMVKGHYPMKNSLPADIEYPDDVEGNYTITRRFSSWETNRTPGKGKNALDVIINNAMTFYAQCDVDVNPNKASDIESVMAFYDYYDVAEHDDEYDDDDDDEYDDDYEEPESTIDLSVEHVYNGYLSEMLNSQYATEVLDPALVGTIQVKIAKGKFVSGVMNSVVTAVIVRDGISRTYVGTMYNGMDVEVLPKLKSDKNSYILHFDSQTMTGRNSFVGEEDIESYIEIQGTRNGMLRKGDSMKDALDYGYKGKWVGYVDIPPEVEDDEEEDVDSEEVESDYSQRIRLCFDIGNGGVVTITGNEPNGVAIKGKSQLIVDASCAYVPVILTLKNGDILRFMVELSDGCDYFEEATDDEEPSWKSEQEVKEYSMGLVDDKGFSGVYVPKNGRVCEIHFFEGGKPSNGFEVSFAPEEQLQMVGVPFAVYAMVNDGLAYPVKFSAKNLPAGLKIDSAVGLVSGIPTKATTEKDKPATITATSTLVKGVSGSAEDISFEILDLPYWAKGNFVGAVEYDFGKGEELFADKGYATMTVSKVGKISGKIQLQGTNWTFSAASFDASSEEETLVAEADARSGRNTRKIILKFANDEIIGTFGDDYKLTFMQQPDWKTYRGEDADEDDELIINDYLNYYTATLTAALVEPTEAEEESDEDAETETEGAEGDNSESETESETESEPEEDAPEQTFGIGYMTAKVSNNGSVKYVGKLPDGTSVSGSATLAYDGSSAYVVIYAAPSAYKGGSVLLMSQLDTASFSTTEDGVWISNAPTATGKYGEGLKASLTLYGSLYSTTDALEDYYYSLGFKTDAPTLDATKKVTDWNDETGKRVTATTTEVFDAVELDCWENLTISLNAKGTAFVVDQKKTNPVKLKEKDEYGNAQYEYEGENDAALTFSFTKATGIFKGSFTCWYDYESNRDETRDKTTITHTSKKVNFEGVACPEEGAMHGFYLWQRTGTYEDPKTGKEKTYKYNESHAVSFE